MKTIESVLVAGAGAIGAAVAWQIQRAIPGAVSILAGGERLERYRKEPFIVNGESCSFTFTNVAGSSNPDLIIVACKTHHLPEVMADLKNHVGEQTLILSLLNGISSERQLGEVFGAHRIPYAMILGIDAVRESNRVSFSKTGKIFFGDAENPEPWSDRVRAIAEFFTRSGVGFSVPENMLNRLWYKFMMNVGLNQLTAIIRRPYRPFKSATREEESASLFADAMREVIAVAAPEGVTLTEKDIEDSFRVLDGLSDEGKTSMCQDVEAGRKTEVELFSRTVMDLGEKHGISVPINTLMYRLIRAIENTY